VRGAQVRCNRNAQVKRHSKKVNMLKNRWTRNGGRPKMQVNRAC